MSRFQRILSAILALQIAIVVVVYWPRGTAAKAGEPLFGDLSVDEIVKYSVSDGEGNRINLSKSFGQWMLPDAGDFFADSQKISTVLEKIVAVQTNRLVTRTPASHKRLQVSDEDYQRRVQFEAEDGEKYILYIGSSSGARATHIRVAGQVEVYLSSELTSWEFGASATDWIDNVYLSVPAADIKAMVLENENGTFEFEKDAEDQWLMMGLEEGEEFDSSKLRTLVTRVASLNMTEPLGKEEKPEYGFDSPGAVVTLMTLNEANESKTYTIRIGKKDPGDNNFFIHSSESAYFVKVTSYSAEDFVNRTREDFLKPPPTPVPTETPGP